jgi:glucose/mannose transport system permease protein
MSSPTVIRKSPSKPRQGSKRGSNQAWLPPLVLFPSLLAVIIFVYIFIFLSVWVSLSNWGTLRMDLSLRQPLLATYGDMFAMSRWQADLRNIIIFTALFLAFSLAIGIMLALFLDRIRFARTIFRNVFLFPYALSFIVTGIAWRWIFNPVTGINRLFDITGLNSLLHVFGVGPLKPGWITDPTVALSLNGFLGIFIPGIKDLGVDLGIPVALIPVVIAACWQLSGFAMAMYMAGLSTIPQELREAARIDGATELQVYTKIIIPLLWPVTVSTAIVLGQVSLKIFDLIYAMSGVGPGFATDVPGIFVFEQTFKATRYNLGAAASIIMLLLVCLIVVPYMWRGLKKA